MAEREPEADRQRALAVGHQLAGGVVDRGDVVGVKRVAHAQRVRGDPESDAEHLPARRQVLWRHDGDERAPADDVQGRDEEPMLSRLRFSRPVKRMFVRTIANY
jgi:hypothetical protein